MLVKGHGSKSSHLMIVTDFPSVEEEKAGFAIQGYTAKKVEEFLQQQDNAFRITLKECYKTTYLREREKDLEAKLVGKRKAAFKRAFEKQEFLDQKIKEDLLHAQPNAVLALGEIALRGLTGHTNIEKYRGSILPLRAKFIGDFPNVKVIPALHPRELFGRYPSRVYTRIDYEKALRYRKIVGPCKEKMLVWVCRTVSALNEYWARVRKQPISFYTCDIETYAGFPTYIGFCFDGYEGVSIPLVDPKINELERAFMLRVLADILRSKYPLVNQNIKYDAYYLEKYGFSLPNIEGDTMLAGHTLYPELPKNLGFYTSVYTDFPYHKDEGKDFNPRKNPDQLGLYNAKDCVVTWKIYEEMVKDLKEYKIYSFYTDFVMPLFHVYRKVDSRGLRVDDERRQALIRKYEALYTKHYFWLQYIANRDINIGSYIDVGNFLYEEVGLPKRTKVSITGKTSYETSAKILEDMYVQQLGEDSFYAEVIRLVIGLRKIEKVLQFLKQMRVHPDGKLRTTYRLEGTESGRTSGSEHLEVDFETIVEIQKTQKKEYNRVFHYGHSFQTLPKHGFTEFEDYDGELGTDVLSIFRPSPGYSFVEGDGSQAEARVVALLANDFETLSLMNKKDVEINSHGIKRDLHTITAIWTTLKEFEEITYRDREKYGKRPRHAGNYDQTPYGLAPIIHQPVSVCQQILSRFHQNVPKLRNVYHRLCVELVRKHGCLVTPYGRRRDFFDKPSDSLWRVVYSYIPQSCVSDHYKNTLLLLEDVFTEEEARTVVEKHDSLMAEVRIDKVKEWAIAFKEISEKPITFEKCSIKRENSLIIPSEILYSEDCWSKNMKEVEL